mgnify:CR=1 FL=1
MTDQPQIEEKPKAPRRKGPWDQRIARFLVRPLVHTRVTPNHITSLRLLSGLAACGCFEVIERFRGTDLLETGSPVIEPQVGGISTEVEDALVHGNS